MHERLNVISHKSYALQCHPISIWESIKGRGAIITPHPDDAIQPKSDADDGIWHPTLHCSALERERETAQNISRLPFSHLTPYKTMSLLKLTFKP